MRKLIAAVVILSGTTFPQNKPRIFVTDEPVEFSNIIRQGQQ